MYTEQCKSKDY